MLSYVCTLEFELVIKRKYVCFSLSPTLLPSLALCLRMFPLACRISMNNHIHMQPFGHNYKCEFCWAWCAFNRLICSLAKRHDTIPRMCRRVEIATKQNMMTNKATTKTTKMWNNHSTAFQLREIYNIHICVYVKRT